MSDEQSTSSEASLILDVRNMLCPMPVIRTGERVAKLNPGDTLTILATDPGTLHDVPAWCRVHGHTLIAITQEGREITVQIQVEAG
jgi:tRNA 2-thiouridine synthesizing protein A